MKKLTTLILALCLAGGIAMAQTQAKPRIVVFVSGMDKPNVGEILATYIGNAFVKAGKYEIIPRSEAVKNKMQELHDYDMSGHVKDSEIIEWGKKNNVSCFCLVQVANVGEYIYVAQIVDVKTGMQLKSAEYTSPDISAEDLRKVASALAGQL